MKFLNKLQNQPEEKRRSLMKVSIVICAIIFFIIWLVVLPYTIKKNKSGKSDELNKALSELRGNLSNYNFSKFKEGVDRLKNIKDEQGKNVNNEQNINREKVVEGLRLPIEK